MRERQSMERERKKCDQEKKQAAEECEKKARQRNDKYVQVGLGRLLRIFYCCEICGQKKQVFFPNLCRNLGTSCKTGKRK